MEEKEEKNIMSMLPAFFYVDNKYVDFVKVCEFFNDMSDLIDNNHWLAKHFLKLSVNIVDGSDKEYYAVFQDKLKTLRFDIKIGEENLITAIKCTSKDDSYYEANYNELKSYVFFHLLESF